MALKAANGAVGQAIDTRDHPASIRNGNDPDEVVSFEDTLVVLPTFNELANLRPIVDGVLSTGCSVLIIDDNSPDGTGQVADDIAAANRRVQVLHRPTKLGLGSAYVAGFEHAINTGYRFVVEMDADGSHQVHDLSPLIAAARAASGLAIGSRYVSGGQTVGWSPRRRVMSRASNAICRLVFGQQLNDWTSGFRCYGTDSLRKVDLERIVSDGFSFQFELAHRYLAQGLPVIEVPISFRERAAGKSKASTREVIKAIRCVGRLISTRGVTRKDRDSESNEARLTPAIKASEVERESGRANNQPLKQAVIGVLAHNEEATIEVCLSAILAEPQVQSVVVVASGCTDRTEEIVRNVAVEDSRVDLIAEPQRSGKASAINLLLRATSQPIVVVLGGDVVFTPGSLRRLVEPLDDPSVGMTGCRPIPTNTRSGVVGHAVHILWALHHELSLRSPKLGEAISFRRPPQAINAFTLVDEATMEQLVLANGLELRYVADSVVRNHGPESLREFLAQRSRVYRGHLELVSQTGYRVSSMNARAVAMAAWRLLRRRSQPARYVLITIVLEGLARFSARLAGFGRPHHAGMWRPIVSSKRVLLSGHVLRAHHDGVHKTRFISQVDATVQHGNGRALIASFRLRVRRDDRITFDRGRLTIAIRGDAGSSEAVLERLQPLLAGFERAASTSGHARAQDAQAAGPGTPNVAETTAEAGLKGSRR